MFDIPQSNELKTLEEVGLGYLKLGQPSNLCPVVKRKTGVSRIEQKASEVSTYGEPTTGLHWLDAEINGFTFKLREVVIRLS